MVNSMVLKHFSCYIKWFDIEELCSSSKLVNLFKVLASFIDVELIPKN